VNEKYFLTSGSPSETKLHSEELDEGLEFKTSWKLCIKLGPYL
jgi:hypothetical protein